MIIYSDYTAVFIALFTTFSKFLIEVGMVWFVFKILFDFISPRKWL